MSRSAVILTVHEDAERRAYLTHTLHSNGFQVWESTGVADAVELIKNDPDLVLLSASVATQSHSSDFGQVLKARVRAASTPVLALVPAEISDREITQVFESGAQALLSASAGPLELVATIRIHLQLRQEKESLRASDRAWSAALDALAGAICLVDEEGLLRRCNRAFGAFLKKDCADLVGSGWIELLNAEARQPVNTLLARVLATRNRDEIDFRYGDGWLHASADPVAPGGAVVVLSDITRRKMAEHALAASERSELLYNRLVDSIPLSVLLIDENMAVVLANKNFLDKSRHSRQETLGKPLSKMFPAVILEELGLQSQIRRAFQDGKALQGQRLSYRAPGVALKTYYYSLVPIQWGRNVEHVLLVMDDVTEQIRLGEEIRRVEHHLASVVESANEIVLSTGLTGEIFSWNSAAERLTGYQLNEVQGKDLYTLLEDPCRQQYQALFGDIQRDNTTHNIQCEITTKEGAAIPVSWVLSPLKNGNGEAIGMVAVGRDLTEERKFEQQIRQAEKLAALGVMAGGIAHELRTPLAIASSAAQFLMEQEISESFRRECAGKVHLGMQRASEIIGNVLRFAHPSSSEKAVVDIAFALRHAIVLIPQSRLNTVEIVSQIPSEPVHILGSASSLEQVFLNLFLNALKAMPKNGTLTISIEQTLREAVVRVSDTGCGIAPGDLGQIFDPFYTTAPVGEGTGLGLSICYSIVKQHKGSITVESALGQGSTFIVKLPMAFTVARL